MKKHAASLAALVAVLCLTAPPAHAQQTTVVARGGTWTPIGQIPAGERYAAKDAMEITWQVALRTKKPSGSFTMGGTTHEMANLQVFDSDDQPPVDSFSFSWEPRAEYWISCTLARRDDGRFSGLCVDFAGQEGWMEIYSTTPRSG